MIRYVLIFLISLAVFTGCGSSDSTSDPIPTSSPTPTASSIPTSSPTPTTSPTPTVSPTPTPVVKTKGYLIDSPVEGVNYVCAEGTGRLTSEKGMFECEKAPVTFKVGKLTLGTLKNFTADGKVYLQDLLGLERNTYEDKSLKLLARLIQSLDDDGKIKDKITITKKLRETLTKEQDFKDMSEYDVILLLQGLGKKLVKECGALSHLGDKRVDCESDGSYYVEPVSTPTPSPTATQKTTIIGYITDDPIANAKVTIYTANNQKISTTTTDNNGKYILKISDSDKEQISKDGFAYIEAEKDGKKLRGFILGLTSTDTEYSSSDTYVSHYSEAIFRIKDTLGLDLSSTKTIYEDFLQSYEKGLYKQDDNSYSFAFRELIEELALDVKDYFYNNAPLLTKDEVISKIQGLNSLEVANFKKASKYSFPLLKIEDNSTTLQIISFSDFNATNDFTVTMNRTVKNNSPFYDKAVLTKFEFSDTNAVLKNVHIETFDINKKSGEVLFSEEYKDELTHNQSSQVIKNNKLKLVLNGQATQNSNKLSKIYQKAYVTRSSTNIYFDKDKKKAFVKLVLDTSTLNQDDDYEVYINAEVYDDDDLFDPDVNSKKVNLKKSQNVYPLDFTDLIDKFKDNGSKHLPIKIRIYENDKSTITDYFTNQISLAEFYGFIDWNNDYDNATISKLTLDETLRGFDTTDYGDNVFQNDKGHETEHVSSLTTHRIIDFDKIVEKDIIPIGQTTQNWNNTYYALIHNEPLFIGDDRTPLLLIHGWQGGDGLTYPSKLLRYENSEFEYWHNFISYYLATPKLYKKYKLYTYHYPSYKHVTYNARILKKLFDKVDKNSVLGKGINGDGVLIIGHSMGGLVARSFIEEHQGLGTNAEKLIKLITLDTPHHGSVSSISNYWRSQAGDIVKDFDTAGAVDLLWDNYDKNYDKNNSHFKATINRNNGDSRYKRLHELDKYKGLFDIYYKYGTLNSVLTSSNTDISHWMNPYLNYLNDLKELQDKKKIKLETFAKEKYIIYTAVTPYMSNDDKLKNPIDNDNLMLLNTQLINGIGYASGGAEPVCSSLLTFQTEVDNITRFTTSMGNLANVPPSKKFIKIENSGDENNNYIPYRIFWDYDHETIMNGQIPKGKSDTFIDELNSLNIKKLGKKTNFSDVDDNPLIYATSRGEYISFASEYLYYGKTSREVDENIVIYESSANPLKMEPVFLVLQKDLLDALNLDNEVETHPSQNSTDFSIDDNITLTFTYPFDTSSVNKALTLEDLDTNTEITFTASFNSEGNILTINPDNNLTYAHKYKLTYQVDGELKNGKTSNVGEELLFTAVEEKAPKDVPLIGVSPDGNFNYNGGNFKLIVSPLDNNQELITDSLTKDNFSFFDIRVTPKDNEDITKSFGEANVTSIDVTTYSKNNNVALIIVLDSSGSMEDNDPQRKRVEASKKLIDLMDINDTIAVIDFGAGTTSGKRVSRVLSDFTDDKTQLKSAIDRVVASGGTPLYESILDAEDMLSSYANKTKVIVVLTDGQANNNNNLDSSIQEAKDNDILIFPIGLGNNLDFKDLERVANDTNGVFGKAVDANSLEEVYSAIGVGALKGKVLVNGKGVFKTPLTSEGEYKVFGKLKTDINNKSLETPFNFIINVKE